MFNFDYQTRNLDSAVEVLLRLEAKLENPSDFLDVVGSILTTSATNRFDTSTAPQGFTWQNLAPLTRARKAKENRGYVDKPLMTNDANLAQSITWQLLNNGSSVVVGSSQQYAKYHQSEKPRKKIPWRPFLGVSTDDRESILDALNEFLEQDALARMNRGR